MTMLAAVAVSMVITGVILGVVWWIVSLPLKPTNEFIITENITVQTLSLYQICTYCKYLKVRQDRSIVRYGNADVEPFVTRLKEEARAIWQRQSSTSRKEIGVTFKVP